MCCVYSCYIVKTARNHRTLSLVFENHYSIRQRSCSHIGKWVKVLIHILLFRCLILNINKKYQPTWILNYTYLSVTTEFGYICILILYMYVCMYIYHMYIIWYIYVYIWNTMYIAYICVYIVYTYLFIRSHRCNC